ncbi:class I SAM-dependent methyltransferase [Bradyrhizobium rifense]|uniref:class I SAM-dependent methyltransferase n=1 Tax=Bradyrhizobium rifense TaxID=515499 RepID=UPI001652E22D|nr:class I SAM-dependent methyltransferase [Bradyrhizobium rifense]
MNRLARDLIKSTFLKVHQVALGGGVVVLPNHYYTPIADVRELARTKDNWAKRSPMTGIDADLARQIARLQEIVKPFEPEYCGNSTYKEGAARGFGPGFGYIEAQALHGVLRWLKPKRVIEVGSGVSTHCATKALALNASEGHPGKITCIEPYPSDYLKSSSEIDLVSSKVEDLDPAVFDRLGAGDFLFIDTSHAVRPIGDVTHLYLEVIPRIKPGCVIHIHDIYFPYSFQRDLLDGLFQTTETPMLQALLANNDRLEILFCLSMLHYDAQDAMKDVFPEYSPAPDDNGLNVPNTTGHFPSSIYLRVRG